MYVFIFASITASLERVYSENAEGVLITFCRLFFNDNSFRVVNENGMKMNETKLALSITTIFTIEYKTNKWKAKNNKPSLNDLHLEKNKLR